MTSRTQVPAVASADAAVASAPEAPSAPEVAAAPESPWAAALSASAPSAPAADAPVEPAPTSEWAGSVPSVPEPVEPSAPEARSPFAPAEDAIEPAPAPGFSPAPEAQAPAMPGQAHDEAPAHQPSLDELIQTAVDEDSEQRSSFFSRLFGRSNKKDAAAVAGAAAAGAAIAGAAAQQQSPQEPVSHASFEPVSAPQPVAPDQPSAPAPMPTAFEAPVAEPEPEPAAFEAAAAPAPAPSVPSAAGEFTPAPAPADPTPAPEFSPEPAAAFSPEPATSFAPAPGADDHGGGVAPGSWDVEQAPAAPSPATPAPQQQSYSPEQLARPDGWEAAGADALQAAEPEVTTSYQPVLQPEESSGGFGGDMTSDVFSELSSLASERPKIEKTRAGLQRRRAKDAAPVEVKPIDEDVSIAPATRDADAVRDRFSSFYSGTQKARDDAAAFARQTEPAEASDT
ncbi:hypothetical protein [uncultured Demequina sp.]|uniref:hypothetical protein n=1 Tax=uncultured Demequina sp. TaxID=693499 RepID=UPI0025ED139E|nr:hypothetical protein [uncultured Demequina sp.]